MLRIRAAGPLLVGLAFALAVQACDDDVVRPSEELLLSACPTALQDVAAPITLNFSVPVLPVSVARGNIVVADAETGLEIPGTLAVTAPNVVQFTPSTPFAFDTKIRVRVQNILSAETESQIPVTLCEITTIPPPITELTWTALPHAGGDILRGASLVAPGAGFVLSELGVLFHRNGADDFDVTYQNPRSNAGFDVSFVTPSHGFMTINDFRKRIALLMESTDGGATFDSVGVMDTTTAQRAYFRPTANPSRSFGVVGGGRTAFAEFYKWHPETSTLSLATGSNQAGYVNDLDFTPADTIKGAAVTNGIKVGSFDERGQLFTTSNGGASWTLVPGFGAGPQTQTYFGVAMRNNGEIYIGGGGGYFARLTPSGGGYSVDTLLAGAIDNLDPSNPFALLFTDVQFAPEDDQIGWVIGAQQIGVVNGEPRYQGFIFMTRDGGATWTRQGVMDAPNYGAEFPRVNRLSVLSGSDAWIVGYGGTVLQYQP